MGIYLKRGKYYIDFYADGKRVRECVGLISRRDAEKALKTRQVEVIQKRFKFKRKAVCPVFEDFMAEYLEYSKAHKSLRSSATDEGRAKPLNEFFGRYRLDQISPFIVEKFIYKRRGTVSRRGILLKNATINRELALLKHVFNKAIEWGKVQHNPVKGIRFFKESPPAPRILGEGEEEQLLSASAFHLRIAILLALYAGLRLGEVLVLRRRDIDLANDVLKVEHGKGDKQREIEICSYLKAALLEFLRIQKADYLFYNERTGKPILNPKTAFLAAIRRSGIGDLRFHDLRHAFATRLVKRGVDLVTVQKLLGHSSIEMTLRYSHPGASERREAVALLGNGHHMDTTHQAVVPLGSVKSLKTCHMPG